MKCSTQAQSIHQLSEVYAKANVEIEQLKEKVCSYMESATMYKGENEDLRARCSELEEMLRQEESRLEIANNLLSDSEKELATQTELKSTFYEASQAAVKEIDRVNKELEETKEALNRAKYVKNYYLELYATEKKKTWWNKLKEWFIQ